MCIKLYSNENLFAWNEFLAGAQNATFLFDRNYLAYHEDRLQDYSMMYYEGNDLKGMVPANISHGEVFVHQGLTYGAFIIQDDSDINLLVRFMKSVCHFLYNQGVKVLYYKEFPSIYSQKPLAEIQYLLSVMQAIPFRTDLTTIINLQKEINFEGKRKKGVKRSYNLGLSIDQNASIPEFWAAVLKPLLKDRHEVEPVHSAEEMQNLQHLFSQNIKQFSVYEAGEIVAGITIYEDRAVAHSQYIAANDRGRQIGALDYLIDYLIKGPYKDFRYFSFGISTTSEGKQLNKGLLDWKKGFDGHQLTLSHYKLETKNYDMLNEYAIK